MTEQKNQTKLAVTIALISMILLSLIVAKIMSDNYQKDDTKIRFELTQDYKKYKDLDYKFDQDKGAELYSKLCSRCHGREAQGSIQFPSLNNAAILNDQDKLLKIVLFGLKGELIRGDKKYNSIMPGFKALAHDDLAHIINYLRVQYADDKALIPTIEIIKAKIDNLKQKAPYEAKILFGN